MPSPLAHGLLGLTVHVLTSRDAAELRSPWRAALVAGAALAPDVDLAFRLVDGRNHHQGYTHTLGAAVAAGLLAAGLLRALRRRRWLASALAVALAWASHILLDTLNADTSPPIGLPALWPLSDRYWKSPLPVFLEIGRTLGWHTLRHNVAAAAWECAVLLPLLLVSWRLKSRLREVGDGTRLRQQGGGGSAGVR